MYGEIICKCSLVDCVLMTDEFIENLKKDKYIDSLLQVYNRTAYNELIQEKKKYSNCAVAFIDANGLSIVNNRYGHEEGDRFLIAVCDAFKTFFRYSDIYRIGGD